MSCDPNPVSVRPLRHWRPLLVAASLLALAACDGARSGTAATSPTRVGQTAPAPGGLEGQVATVATADGRTVTELAIAGGKGVEPGTFFRVLSPDGSRIKGMLQSTETPGPGRCIARVLTLTDRGDPPAPGDRVRELTELADPGAATEGEAKAKAAVGTAAAAGDEERFAAVRAQYQRLLAEAIARHDADLAETRKAAETKLTQQDEDHRKALAERERLHATELAAARAAGGEQALAAAGSEREAAVKRSRDAVTERDNLRVQVDALVAAQDELKRRIERLVAERAESERAGAARLRAEGEAREQLAARLASAERQAGGAASAAAALLSRDPDRSEGVLERLDRLHAESTVSADRAKRAEAAATEAQEALLAVRRQLAETEAARDAAVAKVTAAGEIDARLASSADGLRAARTELAGARERISAAELARLEGERSLYDLSARVLRLPKAGPELSALQERLRALMAAQAMTAPGDPDAPERKP